MNINVLVSGVIDSPISTVKTSYPADPITPTTPSPPILPRITRTGIRQEVTDDEDFEVWQLSDKNFCTMQVSGIC